jgi:hypothetical protein
MEPQSSRFRSVSSGSSYGLTLASVGRRLSDPAPGPPADPLAQRHARAAARYHEQLRVSHLAPEVRSRVARQDGAIAHHAQAGARAQQQYHVALTNHRTQQAQAARRLAALLRQPAPPTAVLRQGIQRSGAETQARDREIALAQAHRKYAEHVRLISGEFAPLVLYDPVIKSVAEGGLMVMGGVAAGAGVVALTAGTRWAWTGASAWAGTGLRASYTAFRASPVAFGKGVFIRGALDFSGQYGANVLLGNGIIGSFGEINVVETGMAGFGVNPYLTAVGSAGVSVSGNKGFTSVFHSVESGHNIRKSKFLAQAGVGLMVGHFGGKIEERLAENQYRAWRTYSLALLMNTPRWGQPAVGAGLRWGQAYGTPLLLGVVEETGEGHFGDKADDWEKAHYPPAAPGPAHPDSPVFRDNAPKR